MISSSRNSSIPIVVITVLAVVVVAVVVVVWTVEATEVVKSVAAEISLNCHCVSLPTEDTLNRIY